MKWYYWALIVGAGGVAVWYFWPNRKPPLDQRQTAFGVGVAQQIAGMMGGLGIGNASGNFL